MHVNHCGINFTHHKFKIHRPNGSRDYLFVYTKTPAIFTLGEEDVYAPPNTVFLYRKGSPQYFRGAEEIYVNDYIHFDTDSEDEEWISELGVVFDTPMQLPNVRDFMKIQQLIVYETKSHSAKSGDAIHALLRYFLIKLAEAMELSQGDGEMKHLESLNWLRNRIYEEPNLPWSVERMARAVNFSPSYLQKLYKSTFNTACMTDVIYARTEKAKNLLVLTDLTAREISDLCGYRNETHFSRQFRKITGHAPQEYRKRYQ